MSGSRQACGVKVEVDGSMVSRVLESRQESKQVNRSEQKKKKNLIPKRAVAQRSTKGTRFSLSKPWKLCRGGAGDVSAQWLLVVQAG